MSSVNVSIDDRWARFVRSPAYYVVAALSGVAATFFPAFLFECGRHGRDYTDWPVVTLWLSTVLICVVHFRLSAPVMRALRSTHKAPAT